jgi:hypothetical protein
METSETQPEAPNPKSIKKGVLGLCHCPGKNLTSGRDQKLHLNDLESDIKFFKDHKEIHTIGTLT